MIGPGVPPDGALCPVDSMRARWSSTNSTISGGALPPALDLTLNPFHSAGLWLAVMIAPAPAFRFVTARLPAGVGPGRSKMWVAIPESARVSATAAANRSEMKRVS